MTWMDWGMVVVALLCLGIGARMGSLFTAACVSAGFFAAYLADTYHASFASMLGGFWGSSVVATILLLASGLLLILGPGWLLSKLTRLMFMGFLDTLFGVFTGFFVAFSVLALGVCALVSFRSDLLATKAWRKSVLARPFYQELEARLGVSELSSPFGVPSQIQNLTTRVKSAAETTEKTLRDTSGRVNNLLKKG